MERLARNAAEAAGAALLVAAAWLVYVPAGLAVAGVLLVATASWWKP